MRKILLSAAALVAAMSANAQVFKVSADANGIGSEEPYTSIEAGTVWGEIPGAATISNAFTTTHKAVDNKNDDFNKVIIDGNEIATSDGVQGQDNPKDADGGNPAVTFNQATGGAVIQIDAKKDGWIYIVAKLSTNKQYMVFEEGLPIGYKIAMESNNEAIPGGVLNLEIKGSGEYNNLTLEQYPAGIGWIIREFTGDAEAASAGNGLGVFYFPVAKDCKYLAHATGSKIMWNAVYFSETEAQSVAVANDAETRTIIGNGGGSAVSNDIWTNTATDVVNWNGIYRFALEGHDGANECIAEIPQATWDKMMTTPFYLQLQPQADWYQIRITNGWWDVEWVGGDIQPGSELLSDNGDGTLTLKVDLAGQPNLVATLLEKHLLFTGSGYTPIKLFFADAANISSVKATKAESNVIYNLSGQQVDKNFKGIVIKNGKKFMNK